MRSFHSFKLLGLFGSVLFFVLFVEANAGRDENITERLFYAGINIPYNSFGGDLNGENVFVGGGEILFVPELKSRFGFELTVGGRLTEPQGLSYASEIYYMISAHEATFDDLESDGVVQKIGLRTKLFFLKKNIVRPYFHGGFGYSWINQEDGSITSSEPYRVGDASYYGFYFEGGGGISVRPHRRVLIHGGLTVCPILLSCVKGVKGKVERAEGIFGLGLSFEVGIAYVFKIIEL